MFTDDATIQCVTVSITSVSLGSADLTLSLAATSTVTGLTPSPSLATVCVVPVEGEYISSRIVLVIEKSLVVVVC